MYLMFRRRLLLAFVTLAIAAIIQGALAWWTISVADENVQRGRLTNDILLRFVELSNSKQRLRTWVSQALLDAGASSAERDQLLSAMQKSLDELNRLAEQAEQLDPDLSDSIRAEHLERRRVIHLLQTGLEPLQQTLLGVATLPDSANPLLTWHAINQTFDAIEGYDLRMLLEQSIQRERLTLQRERQTADESLSLVRGLALATALSIAAAAALLALYFSKALRKPLQQLIRGTQALQRGHLHHRIPARRRDEFAQIAHSVNLLAAELGQHRQRETDARQQLEALVAARTSELQQALDTLQQVDLRRRQLFADISHELRTPTTAIRGEAEITLRGQDKAVDDYKVALQRIVQTSVQLGLVIEDLLSMARSDIDTLVLERRLIMVEQPLREAIAQIKPSARLKSIHLACHIHSKTMLMGDQQRLRQVFSLLLDNAVNYSNPYSQIEIYSERLPTVNEHQPDYWQVSIHNRGIPIHADELTQVFQRSFRGAAARVHRPDGNGLGLPIASSLIHAHHGQIQLDSSEQHGTIAQVLLPIPSSTLAGKSSDATYLDH